MSQVGLKTIVGDKFTLLHISDLHFSDHADETESTSFHDHKKAAKLCDAVLSLRADLTLVSGDLTDEGRREQLLRVREFLFGTYSVSGSKRIGLSLDPKKVRVLPGNHDAFDFNNTSGSLFERVQRSLENFHSIFPDVVCGPNSCSYEWIEAKGWNAYLAYADSCFVGDPHWEHTQPKGVRFAETTAKGKLADGQARKLLRWCDDGRAGRLMVGDDGNRVAIPPEAFIPSLKIMIMHHYLFEPRNHRDDPLMKFIDECRVFRNIALADFDVLLCGHKHVPDFTPHTYGYHMGKEGRWQYSFNCLRRSAGMASLPLRQLPVSGKTPSRFLRFFLSLVSSHNNSNLETGGNRSHEEELETLSLVIEKPREFERNMRAIIDEMRSAGGAFVDPEDCMELAKRFEEEFGADERKAISNKMKDVGRKLVATFARRPFIQILAGSATKRARRNDSVRGFYVHEFDWFDGGYRVTTKPFEWCDSSATFEPTESKSYTIPISRHP